MLAVLQPAGLAVLLLEGGKRRLEPGDLAGLVLRARLERPDLALEGDVASVARRGCGTHRVDRRLRLGNVAPRLVRVAVGLLGARGVDGRGQREAVTQPALQPIDQQRLLARLAAQRLDLRAQRHLGVGRIAGRLAAASAARGERHRQPLDLRVLLCVDRAYLLERLLVPPGARRQLGDLAVAVEQQPLGLRQPRLHPRQPVGDRLLQHAAGVLVLLQIGLELHRRPSPASRCWRRDG